MKYCSILKDYKKYSKAIWLYTLLVLLPVFRKTIFNVGVEAGTYDGGLNQSTTLAVVCILCSAFVILNNFNSTKKVFRAISPLLLYYIYCFFSFLYAGHMIPIMFKSLEVIASLILVSIIIYRIKSNRLALSYLILLCVVPILLDLVARRFSYFHTNTYSFSAVLGLMLCLGGIRYDVYRWREVALLVFFFIFSIIVGTSSASYISVLIALIVFLGVSKRGIKFSQIFVVILITVLAYKLFENIIFDLVFYGKSQEAVENGTGRYVAWAIFLEKIKENPILGYGFLVGERMGGTQFGISIPLISTHNTFLSVLIGTGAIGMIFFIVFLWKWCRRIINKSLSGNRYALILLPVFAGFFVNTNSFPALGSDWNYVGLALYAIYAFTQLKI